METEDHQKYRLSSGLTLQEFQELLKRSDGSSDPFVLKVAAPRVAGVLDGVEGTGAWYRVLWILCFSILISIG